MVGIGFEVMVVLIVMVGEVCKMGVVLLYLFVDVVIFDVEFMFGLLCVVMVVIGIDVMVYVIEVYMFVWLKNLVFDMLVMYVLMLLLCNLFVVCDDGWNWYVCEVMLVGVMFVG